MDLYALWYTNDVDGWYLEADGSLVAFKSQDAVDRYALACGLDLSSEQPVFRDLDLIQSWLDSDLPRIDCKAALSAWNWFADLDTTVFMRSRFRELQRPSKVYEKLFAGTNPPVFNNTGVDYVPGWELAEIKELKHILRKGLGLFRDHLRIRSEPVSSTDH